MSLASKASRDGKQDGLPAGPRRPDLTPARHHAMGDKSIWVMKGQNRHQCLSVLPTRHHGTQHDPDCHAVKSISWRTIHDIIARRRPANWMVLRAFMEGGRQARQKLIEGMGGKAWRPHYQPDYRDADHRGFAGRGKWRGTEPDGQRD